MKRNITVSIGCPYAINTTMFKGFKTSYEKFLPTLDEGYVADRLVREFVAKK
jgi:short-subunit dehydrogenase